MEIDKKEMWYESIRADLDAMEDYVEEMEHQDLVDYKKTRYKFYEELSDGKQKIGEDWHEFKIYMEDKLREIRIKFTT